MLFGTAYRVVTPTSSKLIDDLEYATQAAFDYNYNQTRPLTGFSFLAFKNSPQEYRTNFSSAAEAALAQIPADWPDVEYLGGDAYMGYNTNYITADPHDGYK